MGSHRGLDASDWLSPSAGPIFRPQVRLGFPETNVYGFLLPTRPRRIFAALPGPKRLILVPNAKHNESLQGTMWQEIERWIDSVLPPSH